MNVRRHHLLFLALGLLLTTAMASADVSLSVSNTAPLAGTYSMRTTFSAPVTTALAYVQDNSPNSEKVYVVSFKMNSDDPNLQASWTNSTSQQILAAREDTTNQVALRINLYRNALAAPQPFALHVFPFTDAGVAFSPRIAVNTQAGTHEYTIEWHAGTAGDGYVKVFRDGDCRKRLDNIDSDTREVDYAQFGKPGSQTNTTVGFVAFDDFVSTRTAQYADNTCP